MEGTRRCVPIASQLVWSCSIQFIVFLDAEDAVPIRKQAFDERKRKLGFLVPCSALKFLAPLMQTPGPILSCLKC